MEHAARNRPSSVSVVIPVWNEAERIGKCLDAILRQSIAVHEIIVVDSGSTDGTLDILARYPIVRVINVPRSDFNHGESRNVGVRAATGDWVLLTVGDARAADDWWVEKLFDGVLDSAVVGVCGTQIVPNEAGSNPLDQFKPISKPETLRFQYKSAAEFDALTPQQKLTSCGWDDVTALYRRDVLLSIPFRPVMYGEDALWAKDALRAGHALVYQQNAYVNHYHHESADFTFRRTILTLCFRYRSFGYLYPSPAVIPLLGRVTRMLFDASLPFTSRVEWLRYNWTNHRARRSAIVAFNSAMKRGATSVDALCSEFVGEPPIPDKKVSDSSRKPIL